MKKFRVVGIVLILLSIVVSSFAINNKFQEYRYTSSYFLSQSMNSVNDAALNIISHVNSSDEYTVGALLNLYEQELKLINAYTDISHSLKLEENSKILNPTNLHLLVPLNHTDWWNKKADDELVWLSETEYHSINKLLDLSKVANKVFEEIDVTYVEKTTPAVAKKLLIGISKEASSIVRR